MTCKIKGGFLVFAIFFLACGQNVEDQDPVFFGNGVHNGWADQHTISLWTRLTERPEGNRDGAKFLEVTNDEHAVLRRSSNRDSLHSAQIPEGLSLSDMEGACPGIAGEVKLRYYPQNESSAVSEIDWQSVDPQKDFTIQWKLEDLKAGTKYLFEVEGRPSRDAEITAVQKGSFTTAPAADEDAAVKFCVVTCHDYIRRDDPVNGHKIYPAMEKLDPDFYLHAGDIEYYDKPFPYAMTEELMRFKWNRLFSLPFQRKFFNEHTTYFMKDDHDALSNDAYPGMTYGTVDYQRGLEIFDKEQFPSHDPTYKTIHWGKNLQIWIVEGRNYRSKNTDPDGPGKTIWGQTQKEWLYKTMSESKATYKLLFSSTPILGPDREKKSDNYANSVFQYEGDEIREFLNKQENLFICVGDRHWQYVTHPPGTQLWEFSAGSGADGHAGGWKQEDRRPEHRFLRVKGGFLLGAIDHINQQPILTFTHYDVDGNAVHEEVFEPI